MNCCLCGRKVSRLFKHHIVPRSVEKELYNPYPQRYLEGMGAEKTIPLCQICAQIVHKLFTNKELASMSFDELRSQDKVAEYLKHDLPVLVLEVRKREIDRARARKRGPSTPQAKRRRWRTIIVPLSFERLSAKEYKRLMTGRNRKSRVFKPNGGI